MFRNYIITILLSLFSFAACTPINQEPAKETITIHTSEELNLYLDKARRQPDNIAILRAIWQYYTTIGDSRSLINYTIPIYKKAVDADNTPVMVISGAYLGQSYCNINQYDSMLYYFDRIKKLATDENMLFPLRLIYNNLAIYEIKIKIDPNKSTQYFHIALDLAKQDGDERSYGLILSNLSAVYHLRNDPAGLKYALESYQIAEASKDSYRLLYAAINTAQMYAVCKNYEQALHYIEKAVLVAEQFPPSGHLYRMMAYSIYADLLYMLDRGQEAEKYYKMALDGDGSIHTYSIMAYLGYGNLLLANHRYNDAINAFSSGAYLSKERKNYELLPQFYIGMSDAYQKIGSTDKAFQYYKQSVAMRDSIFNIEKEREFNRLASQYEKSRHEQEIQKKELSYINQKRKTSTIIFILVVFLLILSMVYVISRKKNQMYRELVKKHQEFVRQTKELRNSVEANSSNEKIGLLNTGKGDEIFKQIEQLFGEEHIYRDNNISLAYLSELINTNQWYVSRSINEYARMSFSSYVNSYRIDEAVSILSDTKNDTPLKVLSDYLGYNSISAFYRSFQKETGVPPSKYRAEVRDMLKTRNHF